jgi:hypothetical protein
MGPTGAALEKPMTRPCIKRKGSIECESCLRVVLLFNLSEREGSSHFGSFQARYQMAGSENTHVILTFTYRTCPSVPEHTAGALFFSAPIAPVRPCFGRPIGDRGVTTSLQRAYLFLGWQQSEEETANRVLQEGIG